MRKFLMPTAVLLVLTGCGGGAGKPPAARPVTVGVIGDMDTTNELISSSAFTADLARQLYLPLFHEEPDFQEHPPSFTPALAESWSFSPDGLTLTVRLKAGLKWSDGTPLTARDAAFTHRAATSPEVAWSGLDAKQYIRSVEAPDDSTLVLTFTRRYPYMLMDANEGPPLPEHAFGKVPFAQWRQHDFSQDRVFSGPFVLKEWRRQETILLEANPACAVPGRPGLRQVVFRIVPDQTALLTQFLSHAVDVMEMIPPRDAEKVKRDPELELVAYPDRQYVYVAWNLKNPLFARKEVRRALSHAINTQEIVDTVWYGHARPAVGPIHTSLWAANRSLRPFPYDPARAREILKAAGAADADGDGILELGGLPFEFEVYTNKGNAIREATLVMVQDQLAKVGVKVVPKPLEWNVFIQKLMARDFPACVQGWRVATKVDLKEIWSTAAIEDGLNIVSYSNPKVDELIERIRGVEDHRQAKALLDEAQALIVEDQPYTFLYENDKLNGLNRRIRNVRMNVLSGYYNLEEWTAP
jgi:peptide/nickel transport system substrate-binding protein